MTNKMIGTNHKTKLEGDSCQQQHGPRVTSEIRLTCFWTLRMSLKEEIKDRRETAHLLYSVRVDDTTCASPYNHRRHIYTRPRRNNNAPHTGP